MSDLLRTIDERIAAIKVNQHHDDIRIKHEALLGGKLEALAALRIAVVKLESIRSNDADPNYPAADHAHEALAAIEAGLGKG